MTRPVENSRVIWVSWARVKSHIRITDGQDQKYKLRSADYDFGASPSSFGQAITRFKKSARQTSLKVSKLTNQLIELCTDNNDYKHNLKVTQFTPLVTTLQVLSHFKRNFALCLIEQWLDRRITWFEIWGGFKFNPTDAFPEHWCYLADGNATDLDASATAIAATLVASVRTATCAMTTTFILTDK